MLNQKSIHALLLLLGPLVLFVLLILGLLFAGPSVIIHGPASRPGPQQIVGFAQMNGYPMATETLLMNGLFATAVVIGALVAWVTRRR